MIPRPGQERIEQARPGTLARVRFDLCWRSDVAIHTDLRVVPRLELGRDRLPPALAAAVLDRPAGHVARLSIAPGELVPGLREELRLGLRADPLRLPVRSGQGPGARIEPRVGRFYPRAILGGVAGIERTDRRPFRVIEVQGDSLKIDLNHPLAGRALDLIVSIESIQAHDGRTDGQGVEVAALITGDGPGMQAPWGEVRTDFWSDGPFERLDPRPDRDFYAKPRLVDHLDREAIAEIRSLYSRLIPRGARILDLMSSWHSHLEPALGPVSVVGLGMNRDELEANPMLTEARVQDLNDDPRLPFADARFTAVVCTVSIEYLIRPLEVLREVARVLEPGGRFIVTFSDRWFPPKVIRIWQELHGFERLALVLEALRESGQFGQLETWSLRGLPRPADDRYADRLSQSDPVYAIWGRRI